MPSLKASLNDLTESLIHIVQGLISSVLAVLQSILALGQEMIKAVIGLVQALVHAVVDMTQGIVGFVVANFLIIVLIGGGILAYQQYTGKRVLGSGQLAGRGQKKLS